MKNKEGCHFPHSGHCHAAIYRQRNLTLLCRAACSLVLLANATLASAAPPPVVQPALRSLITSMPQGGWAKVTQNAYSVVWTPLQLRPLVKSGNPTPHKIISAWSGFAWDSGRGDLIIYGGGHANYSGNDVYRWRSSTLQWERASLPSEIYKLPGSDAAYTAIDGPDAAPPSAHTYDNNLYLPVVGRFVTWGGASYNIGNFLRPDEANPAALRTTGPYLFDPTKAHAAKVGGTTGSHVTREAPYTEVVGGNMWQNRDLPLNLAGQYPSVRHVAGCTAYGEEGVRDVVYIGAHEGKASGLHLYRYTLNHVDVPALDTMEKVGRYWHGPGNQTACAYDPFMKVFVRTGASGKPFFYWDLTTPGTGNRDLMVANTGSIATFDAWLIANNKKIGNCGLDFDPRARQFAVWCGGGSVWMLNSPAGNNGTANWTMTEKRSTSAAIPSQATGSGVLGKWKYIPGYDVFVALEDHTQGNVWVYKPMGWSGTTGVVNAQPSASITSPAHGSMFMQEAPVAIRVNAADTDGSILKVEFFADGNYIGEDSAPPYAFNWTPTTAGNHVLSVRANDDTGGATTSSTVTIVQLP